MYSVSGVTRLATDAGDVAEEYGLRERDEEPEDDAAEESSSDDCPPESGSKEPWRWDCTHA